jgi:quinol-cytochrome oxidoreductase complex cytochrome b subunit
MVHLYLVSRQGLFSPSPPSLPSEGERSEGVVRGQAPQTYTDVVLRGLIWVVLSFGIVLTLAVVFPVELAGRADPLTYQSVKPAWYFLPIYGLLKLLPQGAGLAVLGLGIIGLFLMPLLGRLFAWGIGLLAVAAIVLLGILGWYG